MLVLKFLLAMLPIIWLLIKLFPRFTAQEELFGSERMLAALNAQPKGSPEEILTNVRRAVDGFVGDAPQFDDLTMLCIEYKGPQAQKGDTQP